jgi:iron complex outermembrane receptor protein
VINGASIPYPVDMAYKISPWELTNFFFNYTIKNQNHFRGTKIKFAVNNIFNAHSLVGITPANAPTAAASFAASPNDLLNLLPGRSFSITVTGGYAPKR